MEINITRLTCSLGRSGVIPEEEYNRRRRIQEMQLELTVLQDANAVEEGNLLLNLKEQWKSADPEEKRPLLFTMLYAVYVDTK